MVPDTSLELLSTVSHSNLGIYIGWTFNIGMRCFGYLVSIIHFFDFSDDDIGQCFLLLELFLARLHFGSTNLQVLVFRFYLAMPHEIVAGC